MNDAMLWLDPVFPDSRIWILFWEEGVFTFYREITIDIPLGGGNLPDLEENQGQNYSTKEEAQAPSELPGTQEHSFSAPDTGKGGCISKQDSGIPLESKWKAVSKDVFTAVVCAVLLGLAVQYLPGLGVIASVFSPLPISMILLRRGVGFGLVSALLMLTILALACGFEAALRLFLQYGVMGLSLGYCFLKGKKPLFTILITTIGYLLGELVSVGFAMTLTGMRPVDLITEVETSYTDFLFMMQRNGLSVDEAMAKDFITYALDLMKKLLPGILAISGLITVFVCYLISAGILRSRGYQILRIRKFDSWHMDWRFAWGLILGLLFFWLGNQLDKFWMESLGGSLLMVFGPTIALCGLSIFIWLLKNLSIPGVLKLIVLVLVLLFVRVSFYGLVLLAIFDSVRDLRPRVLSWLNERLH